MSAEDGSNARRRNRVLNAIGEGYRTTLDLEHHLAMDRGAVVRHLTSLERQGLVRYHRQTDSYDLTEAAPMFPRRKNPTDSQPVVSPANAGNPGAATSRRAADAAVAAPLSLEAQRDDLVHAMDPHALAIDAVGDDSVLLARLDAALEQGMPSPDLRAVPRYRRAAAVETALDEWARGTLGGPCSVCGCTVARRGYLPHRSIDGPASTPSFQNGKCDFCREILRTTDEDRLMRHVFSAKVGLRNFDGRGYGKYIPTFAELKQELPGIRPGEPWSYIPQGLLDGILKAADFPRHCFVTTRRDSLLHSFDNITAPIHDDSTLPAVKQRVPVFVEPTEREKRLEREWQEFQERSAKFRASFKEEQTRSIDYVDPHGGLPKTFHYLSASAPGSPVTGGILVPLGK